MTPAFHFVAATVAACSRQLARRTEWRRAHGCLAGIGSTIEDCWQWQTKVVIVTWHIYGDNVYEIVWCVTRVNKICICKRSPVQKTNITLSWFCLSLSASLQYALHHGNTSLVLMHNTVKYYYILYYITSLYKWQNIYHSNKVAAADSEYRCLF